MFGFVESANLGWRHPLVFGTLIGGFASLIVFVFVEKRVAAPMVPLSLFKSRSFTGANLLTLLLYAALGIFFFLFPMNLIQVQKYSTTATGAAALPLILLMFFLSRWSGGLVARFGPKLPLIVGPLIAAAGFFLFTLPSSAVAIGRPSFLPSWFWVWAWPSASLLCHRGHEFRRPGPGRHCLGYQQCRVPRRRRVGRRRFRNCDGQRIQRQSAAFRRWYESPARPLHQIQSSVIRLADLEIPAGLDPQTTSAVQTAIAHAFISAFRLVTLLCAALAVASAAVAARMVPPGEQSVRF